MCQVPSSQTNNTALMKPIFYYLYPVFRRLCSICLPGLISSFYNILNLATSASDPIKPSLRRETFPPYFDKVVKDYKNRRNKLFKTHMESSSAHDYFVSAARHKFNYPKRQSHCKYLQLIKSLLLINRRYLYKFVNSETQTSAMSLSSGDIKTSNLCWI